MDSEKLEAAPLHEQVIAGCGFEHITASVLLAHGCTILAVF